MLQNLKELYKYRALVKALVMRHLALRYRGSLLGFLWSLINPLCLMLVYTLVFHFYIRFNGVPNYAIFLLCGLLPWTWFSSGVMEGTGSIVGSGHLITKSMFPAHILPTVAVLTSFVHYVLALPILFGFMLLAGMEFHSTLLLLPLLLLMQLCFIHGIAMMLSALNVYYRDVQHIVSNLLTFLFFLCPIVYPASSVPERFRFSLNYNPLSAFTTAYQQIILEGILPNVTVVICIISSVLVSLILGNLIFDSYRESFAESL